MIKYYLTLLLLLISFSIYSQEEVIEETIIEEVEIYEEEDYKPPTGIEKFSENRAYGLKNHDTNVILLPAVYGSIYERAKQIYEVWDRSNYGLYDALNERFILPLEYERISVYSTNGGYIKNSDSTYIISVQKNGKKGLLNQDLSPILSTEYDKLEVNKNRVRLVKDKKEGVYFFDDSRKAIPLIYDTVLSIYPTDCHFGLLNDEYYFFDENGKLLVKKAKSVGRFRHRWNSKTSRNILIVNKKGKAGIYDAENKEFTLPLKYDRLTDEFEQHFIVSKKSKFGLVDQNNKIVIPFDYESLSFLKPLKISDPLMASKNGKYALINREKILTDFIYDEIEALNDFYKAKLNGKYVILNRDGNLISKESFDNVGSFYGSKAAVFNNGNIGYINISGEIISPITRKSKARGYSNIDSMFVDFVRVLKTKDDARLMAFTKDVMFDEYTEEFFDRIYYQYRGFPRKMREKEYTIEQANERFFKSVKRFRDRLNRRKQLEGLEYVKLENSRFSYWERKAKLLGIETYGILKNGEDRYRFKIGEMIYADGYWKSFTMPRRL